MKRPLPVAAVALLMFLPATASAEGGRACDPYASADQPCLLPFPNDRNLTVADRSSDSGRRVRLSRAAMPKNKKGVRADPAGWSRQDGFSPGQTIVVKIPGLDTPAALARTNPVGLTDIARYADRSAPVVLLDATTGRRQPIFVEIDRQATKAKATSLLIHPARNLLEGRRYVVALRNLRTASGARIAAPEGFVAFRSGKHTDANWRRVASVLAKGGIATDTSLYLAWDLTVASERNLAGRVLAIRDAAFAELGDANLADGKIVGRAPAFRITSVKDASNTPDLDPRLQRQIAGEMTVPCYLNKTGCPPGAQFRFGSAATTATPLRTAGSAAQVPFVCNIPKVASAATPARISLYGHGLLGSPDEIDAGNVKDMSQEHDFVFCATAWAGMSEQDVGNAVAILQDISKFPSLADRLQQGFVNFLYLGRLMAHPSGLGTNAAFQDGGRPLIDTSNLYYDGNSQGGINGGALTALAPDFRRAVVGVTGMNYSILLTRSADWKTYAGIYNPSYPDESVRPLGLSLIQMLWDRGEANGYAHHITTDPLKNTPAHTLLMQVAIGDHQVSNYTAEIEARTIGASLRVPATAPGRMLDRNPHWGIPKITRFPFSGSALVFWDSGPGRTTPAPLTNQAPPKGEDPHEDVRSTPAARTQKSAFLLPGGRVTEVCATTPCRTKAFTP